MSSIGGQEFSIMRGVPIALSQTVEEWRVPGLDGYGAQTLGKGDGLFRLETVAYLIGTADTLIANCLALKGTLVTIVDDWGSTVNNVLVKGINASRPEAKAAIIFGGYTGTRCALLWDLVATQ
jgi:hypothetical protein